MSSEMAWRAASLISRGAAKSGKPWERLTALCLRARRVISRITDSVNCSALAESMRRAMWVMLVSGVDMGRYCSARELRSEVRCRVSDIRYRISDIGYRISGRGVRGADSEALDFCVVSKCCHDPLYLDRGGRLWWRMSL